MHKLTLLALLLLPLPAFAEPSITSLAANESLANGGPNHPTALLLDHNHTDLWLTSEGQGLWRFRQASADNPWQQFPKAAPATGPGDDFTTALAQDNKHRLWVGTNNHGVSVFNGDTWQTYNTWGPSAGPAGQHVYALAANPQNGDVWIATNAGLTRYADANQAWTTFGRPEGLPADQFRALAVAPNGDLLAATAIDGLLIGHPADHFQKWDHLPGRRLDDEPAAASGKGLPSPEGTALAVDRDGRIFLGTPTGLAISTDHGKTFSFLRGKDWVEKVQRRYQGAPENFSPADPGLLSEDWITALSLDSQNKLWISHRTTGFERFDPESSNTLVSQTDSPQLDTGKPAVNYIRGIAITPDARPLIARYLVPPTLFDLSDAKVPPEKPADTPAPAALPKPAAPPTIDDLKAWQAKFTALAAIDKSNPAPDGAYLGEDWSTAGDWIGHIGRQFARLGAQDTFAAEGYAASVTLGGHYPNLSVDSISFALNPNLPRQGLLNPASSRRIISELNDQSFDDSVNAYAVQGPDLWVKINIPAEGPHRISIYCLNPDGQTSRNSLRDFVFELRPDTRVKPADGATDTAPASDLSPDERLALEKLPILAHARASDMFPGHYQQFLVRDPGLYWIKINRNHAFVTKLFGVFIDQLGPPYATAPHANYTYDNDPPAPDLTKLPAKSDREAEARKLWQLAEKSWNLPTAETLIPRAQLLAYRAADADHANPDLLARWRWKLGLWSTPDRTLYDQHTTPQ